MARGYHGIALLTKDAKVLIAGGVSLEGPYGVGSERADMRFYEPGYLHQGERPQWGDVQEPISMSAGKARITIPYAGPDLKEQGGVVLMALGSFTHHFDHNQRYLPLKYVRNGNMLEITPPTNTSIAPKGDYILYLVRPSEITGEKAGMLRDFGIPSVGKHVVLN
ncbi:galactose oxidase-like domain-containing protein [Candidatus Entotheonella palauensis]|nr:galactose oxidase-like domain-containing protein [Candidatus Entotheonella palauensis]